MISYFFQPHCFHLNGIGALVLDHQGKNRLHDHFQNHWNAEQ